MIQLVRTICMQYSIYLFWLLIYWRSGGGRHRSKEPALPPLQPLRPRRAPEDEEGGGGKSIRSFLLSSRYIKYIDTDVHTYNTYRHYIHACIFT